MRRTATAAVAALRRTRAGALTLFAVAAIAAAGCGADDFPNNPRPASPVEVTAVITDKRVTVSPDPPGAGEVVITISNQSGEPARLTFNGPTEASSNEIIAGGTGSLTVDLKTGTYEASAGAAIGTKPDEVLVGPDRPSAQNDLLLP